MEIEEAVQLLDADLARKRAVHGTGTIPTGSFGLDLALGGGYRKGAICELSGDFSTYKTVFAMHTVAQAQKSGPVLWLDSGFEFRPDVARQLGVDLSLLWVAHPSDVDQAMAIMRHGAADYALMVLDSASGLSWDDETISMVDRCFHWLKNDLQPTSTALFISNEFATKDETFTRELRMWSSQQVRMMPYGRHGAEVTVIRSASSRPGNYRMRFKFGKDAVFDSEYELVMLAEYLGLIEVRGSWGYFQGEKLGHGLKGCIRQIQDHPGYALNIRDAIRKALA